MKDQSELMIPLPIKDFVSGVTAPVNLYIRLSDEKFVLIAHAGTRPTKEQISTYENKEVHYLWVRADEHHLVIQQHIAFAGVVIGRKDVAAKRKTQILSNAAESLYVQLSHMGLNIGSFNHAKQVTEAMVTLVETHVKLADVMIGLNECSDELVKHSMAVSMVSVLIGTGMEWTNKGIFEKIALGGLFHDIGLKTLPPDLIKKARVDMSFDEIQTYETHPYRGAQLLTSLGIVPDDVISVVLEHHENAAGQGFPRRLRNIKMHPMARVVSLANEFVNLTVLNPNCTRPKSAREAIMHIEHVMGQPFDKETFKALIGVVDKDGASAA